MDANISACPSGFQEFEIKSEVENIASARSVINAIRFEVRCQVGILEKNQKVVNGTRFWDAQTKSTYSVRDEEVDQDCTFLLEPNLLPLRDLNGTMFDSDTVSALNLEAQVPGFLQHLRLRLEEDLRFLNTFETLFMANLKRLNYFLDILSQIIEHDPRKASNVIRTE